MVCKSSMYEILYCDLIIMVCKSSKYEFNINYVIIEKKIKYFQII